METSGQPSRPNRFIPGEKAPPGTHWVGNWVGPRAGPDTMEKKKSPAPDGNRTPAAQFLAVPTWNYIAYKNTITVLTYSIFRRIQGAVL
jgi:hypothetical protein